MTTSPAVRQVIAVLTACLAVAACAGERPGGDPVTSARLDSGITSSNGGGQRALGSTPNIGVGPNGPSATRVNNSQGSTY